MSWWVATFWEMNPMFLVSWVFWVIFSICLHELAHGWAAIRQGDDTPIHTGHMTWNPMVHMGPTALILFALFGFTYGMMPVDPSRFRGRYGEAFVAAAGPLCNLLQFVILMLVLVPWVAFAERAGVDETFFKNMQTFLFVGGAINLLGFCFNLIPIPPLDGWRIACNFSRPFAELWQGERGAVMGFIGFALIFLVGGRYVFSFALETTAAVRNGGAWILEMIFA
jgi:Zn-dependent protease